MIASMLWSEILTPRLKALAMPFDCRFLPIKSEHSRYGERMIFTIRSVPISPLPRIAVFSFFWSLFFIFSP